MKQTVFACLPILLLAGIALAQTPKPKGSSLSEAAGKPIERIQQSQRVWYENEVGCVSCHHHSLPEFVQAEARARGIKFDSKYAGEVTAKSFALFRDLDEAVQGCQHIDVMDEAWRLFAANAAGLPDNLTTAALAQYLASAQQSDGGWRTMDARPPQSHSRFTATAVSTHGVARYLPDSFEEEKQTVLRRAREWLLKTRPVTTEDRAFQLLGLLWSGTEEGARKKSAEGLRGEQRDDGGWSQAPGEPSDAYSTGEALYALHKAAGVPTNDPAYRKGLQFLLTKQETDGTWKVESRMHEVVNASPPYFNAGFPHGRYHQFSSIAGTAWATAAVLQAIPVLKDAKKAPLPDFVPPEEKEEWVRVALNGSAAELKAALAKGLKADARTKAGTTALMLAARDPAKVKVLLEAGADVNARADSGFSALMVAARHHGNAETVKLLLKAGAVVNMPKGAMVRNEASPLFVAATSGDVAMVRMLLDAKANVEADMHVLGIMWTSPLRAAAQRGDTATLDILLKDKADPNRGNEARINALHQAIIANHLEVVKTLLAGGAKVNQADSEGFTPLHYAAYANHADSAVAEALVAAGADPKAKDRFNRTPLEAAKTLNRVKVAAVLAGRK